MNPLAVFISNAKLQSLDIEAQRLRNDLEHVITTFNNTIKTYQHSPDSCLDLHFQYLTKWFAEPYLTEIECLRQCIQSCEGKSQNILLAIASNLLRDYSQQEPADLRIRRRYSPMPTTALIKVFTKNALHFIENLAGAQSILGEIAKGEAYLSDNRQFLTYWQNHQPQMLFDGAITSPPYATALPYIDTQRLSLIWLRLCQPQELKTLEEDLTGSREVRGKNKLLWKQRLNKNQYELENSVHDFCMKLAHSLTDQDGFRRQAVPLLLYRYFYNMKRMFEQVKAMLKENAPFALVVGHNRTTLGGHHFDINTPLHLQKLAESCGWTHLESIPLQTYQRYDIHSANSVKLETLLILKR